MGILGYKPTDPKTRRQNGRRRNREWEQSEKIGPLSFSLPLSAFCSSVFVRRRATEKERETGTIITVGTAAAAAKKKKKSICFCGRKERLRQGSRRGWGNPPLLAPQRRLFGNFLSSWHYSEWEMDRQGARHQ